MTAVKAIRKAARQYRQERGLTLREAAANTGVSLAAYARLEQFGSCHVTTLEKLKRGTGKSYDELLGAQ